MIFRRYGLVLTAFAAFLLPRAAQCADLAFEIPPAPVSLDLAGQPVKVVVSGHLAGGGNDRPLTLDLRADLGEFQSHLTPLLAAELNQDNKCGDRIAVQNATLAPAAPSGHLAVRLRFEKWACIKAFGKQNATRIVGGDAVVNVILTPRIEPPNGIRVDAEVERIDADGSLGEILRSGTIGPMLRDKIRESLQRSIEKAMRLENVAPAQARPFVAIESVAFDDRGSGVLGLHLAARLAIPADQLSAVVEEFRNRR